MARKDKIQLQQSQDMESIDADLAAAMDALEQKNQEVASLLSACEPVPPSDNAGEDGASPAAYAELPEPETSESPAPAETPEPN